jgi:hypothetical protein
MNPDSSDFSALEPGTAKTGTEDTVVIDPQIIDPAPAETINPLPSDPLTPINKNESDALTNTGTPSNTSNGNIILVNSPVYISTESNNTYNYTSIENNTTIVSQGFSTPSQSNKKARIYRLGSRQLFSGNRRRSRVDRITNFDAEAGDTLELSRGIFKGIGELSFVSVANRKERRRAARTDNDIIYEQSTGRLYFNANSGDGGFGSKGGLFAILESTPLINDSHFVIF